MNFEGARAYNRNGRRVRRKGWVTDQWITFNSAMKVTFQDIDAEDWEAEPEAVKVALLKGAQGVFDDGGVTIMYPGVQYGTYIRFADIDALKDAADKARGTGAYERATTVAAHPLEGVA